MTAQTTTNHIVRDLAIGVASAALLITPTVWTVAYASQSNSSSQNSSQFAGQQPGQQGGSMNGNQQGSGNGSMQAGPNSQSAPGGKSSPDMQGMPGIQGNNGPGNSGNGAPGNQQGNSPNNNFTMPSAPNQQGQGAQNFQSSDAGQSNGQTSDNSSGSNDSSNSSSSQQNTMQAPPSGGMGSGLTGGGGASSNTELIALLQKNASSYRWVAATTGSQNAASYQLASDEPIMAIGGFNGTDDYPTLAQFKEYVKKRLIHYYISGGNMGGGQMGGSSAATEIAQWIASNFTAKTVGNTTIYDLTESTSTTTNN
ncbi:hypothetical protein EJ419_07655 [Alloscardovia theropitheci]|uniref:Putative mannosyltransferase YkcA/B-like C-terminal domain-containing protein n=1 Tax=Alloscardovia theropitheci TaxID=2496842 RepID=A0A4R0QWW6_9BIFI|nr:hypothetical protein [Alloscardovia theropitheci]TCD53831.1 hypothetical protein EJ419_07655 [Alloscardovia theropitheci]